MAAIDDLKAEVARSTAATEKLIQLIHNHPSDATVAMDEQAMAEAAATLKASNDAAEAAAAALAPAQPAA